jgi:hypothetical protein
VDGVERMMFGDWGWIATSGSEAETGRNRSRISIVFNSRVTHIISYACIELYYLALSEPCSTVTFCL